MPNFKALDKKLERVSKKIAEDRDRLDAIIADAEGLSESCQRAYEALQEARDALSEYV